MDNRNTGYSNTGYSNTGDRNTGDRNTGDRNTGYSNAGYRNTGDSNTGNSNTGDWNTGNSNTGDGNTGDWNTGDWNTGYFCTETPSPVFFDKPWPGHTWQEAVNLIPEVDLPVGAQFISSDDMTEQQKKDNPTYAAIGGILVATTMKLQEAFPLAWAKMTIEERAEWTSLPNFDADKFKACTGVDVSATDLPDEITVDGVTYIRKH